MTEKIYKTAYGDATNDVLTVENDANLCSWINNFIGNQASKTATYSGPGKYYMKYTHVPDLEHPGENLATTMVISTQWFEFSSSISSVLILSKQGCFSVASGTSLMQPRW